MDSVNEFPFTDISSVLIDYIIWGGAIICHFPDMRKYKDTRGLIWDFDPAAYGIPLVSRQRELIDAVQAGLDHTGGPHLYPILRDKMHSTHGNYTRS